MRISDWSSDVCSSDLAAQAALAGAEASVRARALDMSFTQVRAPIGGRISDRRVDAGQLLAGGEGAPSQVLTPLHALRPVPFRFHTSADLLLKAYSGPQRGDTGPPVAGHHQSTTHRP